MKRRALLGLVPAILAGAFRPRAATPRPATPSWNAADWASYNRAYAVPRKQIVYEVEISSPGVAAFGAQLDRAFAEAERRRPHPFAALFEDAK